LGIIKIDAVLDGIKRGEINKFDIASYILSKIPF